MFFLIWKFFYKIVTTFFNPFKAKRFTCINRPPFIIIIFLILLINKGINRAVTYSGLGSLDRIFGFFFGFIRAYVIVVCIYTTINIVYNHNKWPINLDDAFTYAWVEKGSNYLIKEFPDKKDYEETKEKVQDI